MLTWACDKAGGMCMTWQHTFVIGSNNVPVLSNTELIKYTKWAASVEEYLEVRNWLRYNALRHLLRESIEHNRLCFCRVVVLGMYLQQSPSEFPTKNLYDLYTTPTDTLFGHNLTTWRIMATTQNSRLYHLFWKYLVKGNIWQDHIIFKNFLALATASR